MTEVHSDRWKTTGSILYVIVITVFDGNAVDDGFDYDVVDDYAEERGWERLHCITRNKVFQFARMGKVRTGIEKEG
ncbi:unnamed protein product [Enterobius vermicularis]|uniref:DUF4177 domain-containing protein n=1 Tax=Enterobius vermicularis TaxID=51028 RepID=A0A0N4VNV1_ENTVE|nr:unnamed protein product [Enterobius vermicularis]